MAITSPDDIAAGLAAAQSMDFLKTLTAPKAAGAFQSGWMAPGNPGAGVAPPLYSAGTGYTMSAATAGAIRYANGSIQNWLARLALACSQPGTIIIYDRLWSCSFAAQTVAATTLTVTTPGSLPARITDFGVDVEAWLESYTVGGASAGTLTLNYLNSNTGAAKAGVITPVTAPVTGQIQPIPVVAGDTGVRSIVSIVNSATMTSGTYGITLMKPVTRMSVIVAGGGDTYDWSKTGLAKLPSDACLFAIFFAANTTAPVVIGTMDVIDK
jgi:hypothetical protein